MTKLVTLLGRKAAPAAKAPEAKTAAAAPQPANAAPEKTEIELDQELFVPAAT